MDYERDFQDEYFKSGYGKLHYKHHKGKGDALILLHGFAASTRSWTKLVNFLPKDLDVYIIDLLGHGESDAPDVEYSMAVYYETIDEFIRNNIDQELILFGHSYGGWIAANYASANRIKGLLLEDCTGLPNFVEERHQRNPKYREEMIKDALKLNPHEHVLRSTLYADNRRMELTKKVLARINCRCIIVWGGGDRIIDPKFAPQFNREIKGSELRMIDGARHTPHYSNPEEVAKILLGLL